MAQVMMECTKRKQTRVFMKKALDSMGSNP